MVAHRVGLFSGRGRQNCHMQHRSNVPTGFDVHFWSWPKWDYAGKTWRGVGRRNREGTVGTFDVTSFMRLECMQYSSASSIRA